MVPPIDALAKLLILVPVGKVMTNESARLMMVRVVISNLMVYCWLTTIGSLLISVTKNWEEGMVRGCNPVT